MAVLRKSMIGALCAVAVGLVPVTGRTAPADSALKALVAGYNDTGQELFQAFSQSPGNIVLSPYSIGTAMAMALAGARGENQAEMAKVLGLALPPDAINDANAAAMASLNAASSATFKLLVANALMLTKNGATVSDDYVATLRGKYAAEVFRDADLGAVNGWVAQKTQGKIDSILDKLDPATVLVLLDAVYFKAPWQDAFPAAATHGGTFHLAGGDAEVPTMRIHGEFPLVARPGYHAIWLPYAGGRIGMIVMLPDGDIADAVKRLDGDAMQALLTELSGSRSVDVSLPRFRASFKTGLVDAFANLGMHRAFDPQTADFSGMTGKSQAALPLTISEIVHRAIIEVAEEGTTAAAVTGVPVAVTAVMNPQPPEQFIVDRPFLFAIADRETGAVLFEGRIVDPR